MVKPVRITLLVLTAACLLAGMLLIEREKLMLQAELLLRSAADSALISGVTLYFTIFMAILMGRYTLLLICSYLEHVRSHSSKITHFPERDDAELPMVSVVVPAYNEGSVITPALNALLEMDYPNYEILVIDDGSSDDTYERAMEIARSSTEVPVRVFSKRNGGKADALNLGLAHARGDFIFNMDGDTKLSQNALRDCIRHFDDERVGAVAGNVKVLNRENTLTRLQALEYVEGLALVRKAQSYFRLVGIIPGPAGMFRKRALMQVHGYDGDTYAEDCDLTLKLLAQGWHVQYEAAAIAYVETPSKPLDLIKQRYRWTRGLLQAIAKHRISLLRPHKAGVHFVMLAYMLFESVLWPISNVLGHIFFVYIGFEYGLALYLLYWWIQLTLLDMVAAVYCIVVEDEDISLLAYAPLFRLCYLLALDVSRVAAAFEELRGVRMNWGKLEREGKL